MLIVTLLRTDGTTEEVLLNAGEDLSSYYTNDYTTSYEYDSNGDGVNDALVEDALVILSIEGDGTLNAGGDVILKSSTGQFSLDKYQDVIIEADTLVLADVLKLDGNKLSASSLMLNLDTFIVSANITGSSIDQLNINASDVISTTDSVDVDDLNINYNSNPEVLSPVSVTKSENDSVFNVNLLLGATDVDGDTLSVENLVLSSGDASGVSSSLGSLTVDPHAYNALSSGEDSVITYTYDIVDGRGGVTHQTASITILGINDAPSLGANFIEITEGGAVVLSSENFSSSDSEDDALTYNVCGVLYGRFEYLSAMGVDVTSFSQLDINNGLVQFVHDGGELQPDYKVSVTDGNLSTDFEVGAVDFIFVNDEPSFIGLTSFDVDENSESQVVGLLSVIDSDDSFHTFSLSDQRFEVVDYQLKLRDGFPLDHESDNNLLLTITATDAGGLSTEADFVITVNDLNEAPQVAGPIELTISDQTLSGGQNLLDLSLVNVDLLSNASDPDNDILHVLEDSLNIASTLPVDVVFSNNIMFIDQVFYKSLSSGEMASVIATYSIVDSAGLVVNQTATVNFVGQNDSPESEELNFHFINENAASLESSIHLLDNIVDPDGDVLTLDNVSFSATGEIEYTLVNHLLTIGDNNYLSQGERDILFVYSNVSDGNGGLLSKKDTVVVTGVNDAPVLSSSLYAITGAVEDEVFSLDFDVLLDNVVDVDLSDKLTITDIRRDDSSPNWSCPLKPVRLSS